MRDRLIQLYQKAYENNINDNPQRFIAIVESNIEVFDFDYSENIDDFNKILKLISDYAIQLYMAGFLKRSIPYFNMAVQKFDQYRALFAVEEENETLYESLVFYRGLTLYYQKEYRLSILDFKYLSQKYPDNDRYKGWYNGLVKESFRKYERASTIFMVIGILGSSLLEPKDKFVILLFIAILAVSLLASALLYIIKRTKLLK